MCPVRPWNASCRAAQLPVGVRDELDEPDRLPDPPRLPIRGEGELGDRNRAVH
jgi:hypothetical protein